MGQKWIVILCCACLLLSGCQVAGLLEQVRDEASSGRESAEDPPSSPQSPREAPAQGSALPSRPKPASPEPAPPRTGDVILQNAGPEDLMAVLQNPDSGVYRSLGEAKAFIDDFGLGGGAGHETILVVPLKENVQITVEEVWLDYSLNFIYTVDTLGEFSGKAGEHLALNTYLAEGIPHARVVAQLDGRYTVWYCQYAGMGAEDVTYIGPVTPEPIDEYSSGINLLSAAAATSAFIFAEGYEELTPEEFIEFPDAYWQTVAYAMTMHKENTEGDFDPYSGELMGVPAWLTDACRLALFPGSEAQPLYTQGSEVYREADEYLMSSCSYGDEIFWEHISSESGGEGKIGWVVIAVTCPELSPEPVTYRVEWAANDPLDVYTPFQYHMTGISLVKE